MIAEISNPQIVAQIVPHNLRMRTLPKRFPNLNLVFESLVYIHMDHFAAGYNGGFWEFYELSNGGFYMSLRSDMEFDVTVQSNYFSDYMSADAASIVANLYTLCHLANKHELNYLTELFHALKDFAIDHDEANKILRAID